MTIAEKLTAIAEGEQRVYEAGQKSMVDESKIIENTITGTGLVMVDDVSEIPHKCSISVDKNADVTVCGKNICPVNEATVNRASFIKLETPIPAGNYWLYVGEVEITSASNTCLIAFYNNGTQVTSIQIPKNNKEHTYGVYFNTSVTDIYLYSGPSYSDAKDMTATWRDIMISVKGGAYEPYNSKVYTVYTGQSIEVDSICPTMTLLTGNAAAITFGYRRSWGMQTEYDRFWDAYQNKGARQDYYCGFTGSGWTNETFKPKYDMKPTNAFQLFRETLVNGDLVNDFGVSIDFSDCTNMQYVFMRCYFDRIGVVDASKTTSLTGAFQNATELKTIDAVVLMEDGKNTFSNAFLGATALENITIVGAIGNNIDFSACPLTHDSLMSIITHLQTKTSGSFVLTLGTDNLAKLTDAEKAIATERGWTLA